jgi:hypothetical protein
MSRTLGEDRRKRSDKHGRLLYTCGRCGRPFWASPGFGSMAGARVSVCGLVLRPPEARCLLEDGLGNRWWPTDEPMPDLLEVDRLQREAEAARTDDG